MTSRWKLLSTLAGVDEVAPVLSVEFLALVTGGSATTYTGTIDCSSVTSSDSLIILTQAEAGGGTTNNVVNNITANATSMITDIATTNSTGAGHTGIFRVEGSAVAGDSTTDISMTYNNGMARQSFIAYRLINGSNPTLGDTDDTQTVSTNPITSTVSATAGDVIFSSAYFSDNSGHDFSISNGTLTETDGVQSGSGSGGGMFSTDAVGSVTVSYTNSGTPNTQGDAIVTAVYTGSGGGGGVTVPEGLSDSLLTITGTNDAWTTRTVDISAYSNAQVYLVFRYQNGNGFAGDIQLDNIQLDGTTYSFENVTHSFETSDNDNSSNYDTVSWTSVLIEADNNREGRWCVDSGGTPSNGTGRTDADDGTWYVYAETSGDAATSGYNIWLRSPLVTLSASPTLQFAEARNGGDIGTLDVHLDVSTGGGGGGGGSDFTPDAVNWNNINETDPDVPHSTNTQTISGIDTTITLEVSFPQTEDQYLVGAYSGINGTGSLYTGAFATSPGSFTFDVVNGDLVTFRAQILGGATTVDGDTVTIVNTSDGNAVLDTFSILIDG